MTVVTANKLLGDPVDRVDGPLKVTGAAPYPSDVTYPGLVHAVLVQSTIAAGTIRSIDAADAEAAPGVLAVITHENAPALAEGPMTPLLGPAPPSPLKDNRILHHGQHVAIVVAETLEQATAAARLVRIDYEETAPVLGIDNPEAAVLRNPWGLETQRGDAAAALASAEVVYDETFAIAAGTNNPLGLFATVARWEGDRLIVHESTQWPTMARQTLATVFNVPENDVQVLVPYLGGGFGAGLRTWPHAILTALAARLVDRPVKLVLTRPQMFTSVGHRAETTQRLRLGATRAGRLVAIDHVGTSTLGAEAANMEFISIETGAAYACPNVATHDRQVRLNIPSPGWMRGPGSEGNFAIESALDELSYTLRIDPIELRLRNYAEVHPQSGLPWSSKALRECYRAGAERFGWTRRTPEIGSMREGNWLVGYGMAGVTFGGAQLPCQVRVSIRRDGSAHVRSAATDIGTGTYTVATQLAAELLGLDIGQVRVEIGDSDLAPAPPSGGSSLATSLGGAIRDAAGNLLRAFLNVLAEDHRSPLQGRRRDDVTAADGRIHLVDDPSVGETYSDILARHELDELAADGEINPQADGAGMAPSGPFAARFAEVRIDAELGLLRVARIVSAVDAGRILNEKLARSQIIGATVMGIGMTMLEETIFDPGSGRIANATFGDYLIPVNADVPDLDVVFVGEPDRFSPIGSKGLGEVGIVGVSAAIANAVYHATGRRIRSLPITIDQLL
jgi:CO/xanthine dehydrogenase Mo-binding subunit